MKNYGQYQLAPSVLEACEKLRELLEAVEDTNLDAVCQTDLGVADYQGQPNPALIRAMGGRLIEIANLSESLIRLTTYDEKRAIEHQKLLPWQFDS